MRAPGFGIVAIAMLAALWLGVAAVHINDRNECERKCDKRGLELWQVRDDGLCLCRRVEIPICAAGAPGVCLP